MRTFKTVTLFASAALLATMLAACTHESTSLGGGADAGSGVAPLRMLSAFAEYPNFVPSSAVVVGDGVFVAGTMYAVGSGVREPAADAPGRIVRVPLVGGPAAEVWRGAYVRGPLVGWNGNVAFRTLAKGERTSGAHRGVTLLDATSFTARELPGPTSAEAFVSDLRAGSNGLHWIVSEFVTVSYEVGVYGYLERQTIEHWNDGASRVEPLLSIDDASMLLFDEDAKVSAKVVPKDATFADSYSLEGNAAKLSDPLDANIPNFYSFSKDLSFIVGRHGVFVGQLLMSSAQLPLVRWERPVAGTSQKMAPAIVASETFGNPLVTRSSAYWVPRGDRGAVRRTPIPGNLPTEDLQIATVEHARDEKHEVVSLTDSADDLVWISVATFANEAPYYRLMATSL